MFAFFDGHCGSPWQIAQSAGAVEYTDCTFAEGWDTPQKCPGYDTKQSDGEAQAVLELWGMRSTSSLTSLPGPLWPGVVAPDRALSMGICLNVKVIARLEFELAYYDSAVHLFNHYTTRTHPWILGVNWIAWNRNVCDS